MMNINFLASIGSWTDDDLQKVHDYWSSNIISIDIPTCDSEMLVAFFNGMLPSVCEQQYKVRLRQAMISLPQHFRMKHCFSRYPADVYMPPIMLFAGLHVKKNNNRVLYNKFTLPETMNTLIKMWQPIALWNPIEPVVNAKTGNMDYKDHRYVPASALAFFNVFACLNPDILKHEAARIENPMAYLQQVVAQMYEDSQKQENRKGTLIETACIGGYLLYLLTSSRANYVVSDAAYMRYIEMYATITPYYRVIADIFDKLRKNEMLRHYQRRLALKTHLAQATMSQAWKDYVSDYYLTKYDIERTLDPMEY